MIDYTWKFYKWIRINKQQWQAILCLQKEREEVGKRQPCNKTELTLDRLVCSDSLNWLQLGVEHNLSFAEHCYWNWWISCSTLHPPSISCFVIFQVKKKSPFINSKTLFWKQNALHKIPTPALVVVFAFYSHLYCFAGEKASTMDICCYIFLIFCKSLLFPVEHYYQTRELILK